MEPESLVCPVGRGREELERVKAPFVLLWIGFCHSPSPGEASAGIALGP